MKPIDQASPRGCFQACVASVLELPLSEVPDFCAPGWADGDWWTAFQQWCSRRGLIAVEIYLDGKRITFAPLPDGLIGILSGKSPRGVFQHSVVVVFENFDFVLAHDPHESRAGIDGQPKSLLFFVRSAGY
jgi:hypothetical protein